MTRFYLSFYYKFLAVFTLILITEDTDYYRRQFENVDLQGLSSIFNLLHLPGELMIPALLFLTLPIFIFTSIRPNFSFRLASFFSFWLCCSFLSNFTHFNSPRVPWIITSLILIFVNPKLQMSVQQNHRYFRAIQDLIFANYILAGIWKILHLGQLSSFAEFLYAFKKTPFEHMAYVMASGSANPNHVELILKTTPIIPYVFGLFVLLQLFSFVPILNERLRVPWAYGLILFHLCSAIAMGLTFDYAIAALLLLVIFVEELIKSEQAPKI